MTAALKGRRTRCDPQTVVEFAICIDLCSGDSDNQKEGDFEHEMSKDASNQPKNETLGEFVRSRRLSLQLSYQDVADRSGLHYSYWNKLENGQYEQPAPKYLRVIAATIDAQLEDLLALAGYDLPERLPSFTPYLRAKYELPPEAVADLERYFDLLRNFYGIPQDQPVFPPTPPKATTPPGPTPKQIDQDLRSAR